MQINPRLGAAFAIPFELAAFIVGGLLAGLWLDRRFVTSPWGLLGGVTVGLVGALRVVFRLVRATESREQDTPRDLNPPAPGPTDPSRAPGAHAEGRHDPAHADDDA